MKTLSLLILGHLLAFNLSQASELRCELEPTQFSKLTQQAWKNVFNNPMMHWKIEFKLDGGPRLVKHHKIAMAGRDMGFHEPIVLCELEDRHYFKRLDPGQLKEYVPFELTAENHLKIQRMGYTAEELLAGEDLDVSPALYNVFKPIEVEE